MGLIPALFAPSTSSLLSPTNTTSSGVNPNFFRVIWKIRESGFFIPISPDTVINSKYVVRSYLDNIL